MTAPVIEGFRLSPLQRCLWSATNEGALRGCCLLRLAGPVDKTRLRSALEALVTRHQVLRTEYRRPAGRKYPLQVIGEEARLDCRWSPEPIDDAGCGVLDAVSSPTQDGVPVLRAVGGPLKAGDHVLALSLPALGCDAFSFANLARELADLYAGASVSGSDEVFQYVQFSEWRCQLEEEGDEDDEAFWHRRLASELAVSPWPWQGGAGDASGVPATLRRTLEGTSASRLAEIAEDHGSTVGHLVLAAWQMLSWRLGGPAELAFGVVFPGREFEVLEPGVGLFARVLPVRASFGQGVDLGTLLGRLETELKEVGERQDDLAPARLLLEAEAARGVALPCVFELVEPAEPVVRDGVGFALVAADCPISPWWVKLTCTVQSEGLDLVFSYRPGAVQGSETERLAEALEALLESLTADPDRPLADHSLVAGAAQRELVTVLARGECLPAAEAPLHRQIERWVAAHPERVAVICGEAEMTYGELDAHASALARRLYESGLGPECRIGLCVERSLEMVVSLVAVLKAGGCYVPLDPTLPIERLRTMAESAGLRAIVVPEEQAQQLPDLGVSVLPLKLGEIVPADGMAEIEVDSGNLAYVLFTSGSTGAPKGVAIGHRQLVSYVDAVRRELAVPEGASWGMVSTFGADLGNTVLFPALASGGRLCLATQEEGVDPGRFSAFVEAREIDCLKIVPSHLTALLRMGRDALALPKRVLVLGGESSSPELIAKLRTLAPGCRIFNHYGPAETTVGVAVFPVEKSSKGDSSLPIGRPLAHCELYLLDGGGWPVPAGIPGELHVGGPQLARGYVGRASETAERFVPHPFAERMGARLYRTGDLVRLDDAGRFVFLGRRDHQIKVRGFRVELGEIELALSGLEGVAEAVVVLRQDGPLGGRLVGYYVTETGSESDDPREELRRRLPEHMLPASLIELAALPLTPNGKIDRRALPAPEEVEARTHRSIVAPRDAVEHVLADIWAEVLGLEVVGVSESFFDLGGHSLLAMQVVSRLKEIFRAELPLRVVFQANTIEELARSLIGVEQRPGLTLKIAETVLKVQRMSSEEVRQSLAQKKSGTDEG